MDDQKIYMRIDVGSGDGSELFVFSERDQVFTELRNIYLKHAADLIAHAARHEFVNVHVQHTVRSLHYALDDSSTDGLANRLMNDFGWIVEIFEADAVTDKTYR